MSTIYNIHKNRNLGRPVINSIDCHTTKISKCRDHHLQPYIKKLKSHVNGSTDIIWKINSVEKISDNSILLNMDVRSLYANIPNKERTKAVKTTLKGKK